MIQLQANATLQNGKYQIEKVIGQGGFGITYVALQVMLGRKVAVKEFFMKQYCTRDDSTSQVSLGTEGSRDMVDRFRKKFFNEALNLARLSHPNIVSIIDVFEENGTAYYVMEYAGGGSLADKLNASGPMSESEALVYIRKIASALSFVHGKHLAHLDVKPANVVLNDKNEPLLIDFGLSKHYTDEGGQTSSTPSGISEGYAPLEQYRQGGVSEFSPTTDIYSLGATLYKLLTGKTPPGAWVINEDGLSTDILKARGVSDKVIATIVKSMKPRRSDRMQSVDEFLSMLDKPEEEIIVAVEETQVLPATPSVETNDSIDPTTVQISPAPATPSNKKFGCGYMMMFAALGAVAMIVILLIVSMFSDGNDTDSASLNEDSTSVVVDTTAQDEVSGTTAATATTPEEKAEPTQAKEEKAVIIHEKEVKHTKKIDHYDEVDSVYVEPTSSRRNRNSKKHRNTSSYDYDYDDDIDWTVVDSCA